MATYRKEKRISGPRRGNTGQQEALREAQQEHEVRLYPEEEEALRDSEVTKGELRGAKKRGLPGKDFRRK